MVSLVLSSEVRSYTNTKKNGDERLEEAAQGRRLEDLSINVKFSVLWLFTEIAMLAHMLLMFFEPGMIEQIMTGVIEGMKMGPGMLLLFAITMLIPLIMAYESITLKDSTNRKANIVLGVVFAGFALIDFISHAMHPSAHAILLSGATVVVPALIAWNAWKWS